MAKKNIKLNDQELQQALFIAKDAVDNIVRIKSASWKVLAVVGITYASFCSKITNIPPNIFTHIIYYAFLVFLLYVVCFEYPNKISNYRSRLRRAYSYFSDEVKKIHEDVDGIPKNDSGDKIYGLFCAIYIIFFIISYTIAKFPIISS